MLAESGSGTLAGSAHMEAFRQIAANDAISIAECINRQYVRRRLAAQFPGQPVLVYFTLTPPVINDRAATVNMLCQLAGQRWRATDEAVSEEVGVEVHTEEKPPQPVTNTSPHTLGTPPAEPVLNAGEMPEKPNREEEPPLNEDEMAALRLLGGGLNPGQVAADAEYTAAALREGMVMNSCNQYGHDADCDGADDAEAEEAAEERERREAEEDERREREMDASSMESAGYTPEEIERVTGIKGDLRLTNDDLRMENSAAAPQDEDEVVTNAAARVFKRDKLGRFAVTGAVLKKNKGARSSRGNPKNPTTKSNTPLKAVRLAKPQAQVDAADHALRATEKKGKVMGAAHIDGKPVNIEAGHPDYHGTRHYKKHNKTNDTSPRKAARAIGAGKTEPEPGEPDKIRRRHGETNASLAEKKDGNYRFITAHKKK